MHTNKKYRRWSRARIEVSVDMNPTQNTHKAMSNANANELKHFGLRT